jgi:hypothetical protein
MNSRMAYTHICNYDYSSIMLIYNLQTNAMAYKNYK